MLISFHKTLTDFQKLKNQLRKRLQHQINQQIKSHKYPCLNTTYNSLNHGNVFHIARAKTKRVNQHVLCPCSSRLPACFQIRHIYSRAACVDGAVKNVYLWHSPHFSNKSHDILWSGLVFVWPYIWIRDAGFGCVAKEANTQHPFARQSTPNTACRNIIYKRQT